MSEEVTSFCVICELCGASSVWERKNYSSDEEWCAAKIYDPCQNPTCPSHKMYNTVPIKACSPVAPSFLSKYRASEYRRLFK